RRLWQKWSASPNRMGGRHRAEQLATPVGAADDETPAPQSPSRLPGSLLPSDPVRAQTPAKALAAGSRPVTIVRTKDWTPARYRSRPAHRRGNSTSGTARRPAPAWLRPSCVRFNREDAADRSEPRTP